MKKCPYCAEEIQEAAIFCRYCQSELPKQDQPVLLTTQPITNKSQKYEMANENVLDNFGNILGRIKRACFPLLHWVRTRAKLVVGITLAFLIAFSVLLFFFKPRISYYRLIEIDGAGTIRGRYPIPSSEHHMLHYRLYRDWQGQLYKIEHGFETNQFNLVGESDQVDPVFGDKIARILFHYPSKEKEVREFFSVDGLPVQDGEGVYQRVHQKFSNKKQKIISYLDSKGTPMSTKSGVWQTQWTLNEKGEATEGVFMDQSGKAMMDTNGIWKVKVLWDSQGRETEESYYGLQGEPIERSDMGISTLKISYDAEGNPMEYSYFGKEGQLKNSKDIGVAIWKLQYDPKGYLIEEQLFGSDEKPVEHSEFGFVKRSYTYNLQGFPTIHAYDIYGKDIEEERISREEKIKQEKIRREKEEEAEELDVADFIDNTQKYIGKEITLPLKVNANDDSNLQELRGNVAEFSSHYSDVSFDIKIHIPEDLPVPRAVHLDWVLVTFACEEGDLNFGNEAISIVRDQGYHEPTVRSKKRPSNVLDAKCSLSDPNFDGTIVEVIGRDPMRPKNRGTLSLGVRAHIYIDSATTHPEIKKVDWSAECNKGRIDVFPGNDDESTYSIEDENFMPEKGIFKVTLRIENKGGNSSVLTGYMEMKIECNPSTNKGKVIEEDDIVLPGYPFGKQYGEGDAVCKIIKGGISFPQKEQKEE